MNEPDEKISQTLPLAELYYRLLQDATNLQMSINLRRDSNTKRIYLERFRPEMIAIYYMVMSNPKVSNDESLTKDLNHWLNADFSNGISRKHYQSSLKLFIRLIEKLLDMGLVEKC